MIEDNVNLNGEFLGISALAIYSAPWFLQLPLLLLVATLFTLKVSRNSQEIQEFAESSASNESDELDMFLSNVNRVFFGFAVPRKNLAAYWVGFIIYLITLMYAIYNTYANLSA